MKPRLLVTTSLERAWGANEEILFLGEWCKDPSRSAIWSRRSSSVCHYHWRDRKKLQIDHQGLEKLNEKFLSNLSNFLNEFHSVKRDKNYWRIIIGPWLLNYIPVLWDRWESLSMANQNLGMLDTFSLDSKLPRGIARDLAGTCKENIKYKFDISNKSSAKVEYSIKTPFPDLCPRLAAQAIINIDNKALTPMWMVEKLRKSGIP